MFTLQEQTNIQDLCRKYPELEDALNLYEEKNKLLLSHFTHEIRNPLTLIYSTLQLLDKKHEDLKQDAYWTQLNEDMKEVFTLLDQLSTYNKSNTLHITSFSLLTLLTDLKISFEPLAKERHVSISMKITKESHPYIDQYSGDYVKLKQAFTNIIKNALEAVDESGTVQITTKYIKKDAMSSDKSSLCILVTNNGEVIPPEILPKIFVPFVTTKLQGSGMGLPISNRIIQAHGGHIDVTSQDNQTTFSIYL